MRRVAFLAVDDEFAGLMQQYLYGVHHDWIVGSVISSSLLHRKNNVAAAVFLMRRSGGMYLAQMVKMKVLRQLVKPGPVLTPTSLARKHGVEIYRTRDINSEESLTKLRSWKPDLIISTNFSQYVGKKAREVAAMGAWNLHKSYLPHYRGMAPNFHALLEGAKSVGATLHMLAKGFDTGDILTQIEVPVEDGNTVYDLNRRTADAGGRLLLDFLDGFDPKNVRITPQPPGDWRSYSYPTREDLRAFRARGCRF